MIACGREEHSDEPAETAALSSVRVVDVFCGAGGLSLGLQQAGLTIAAGIDVDPACEYPFSHNVKAPFHLRDVSEVTVDGVRGMFGGAEVRVLAGCAPCQPFSGYTTKRRDADERWQLLIQFLRLVNEVQPDIVTLENVPRLTLLPLWAEFVSSVRSLGYRLDWRILDVADYGVPQNRRRVVLLGSRIGDIRLPEPSVSAHRTVRWAIGDLPPIGAGASWAGDPLHASRVLTAVNLDRIKISKQGTTWKEWPEHMRVACHKTEGGKTYPSVYGRMSWDRPAPTMTTQYYGYGNGRFGHPDQDRAISLREGAILQSFPPDFAFVKPGRKVNFREIGKLIGNAVPPKLGAAIGRTIRDHVLALT